MSDEKIGDVGTERIREGDAHPEVHVKLCLQPQIYPWSIG